MAAKPFPPPPLPPLASLLGKNLIWAAILFLYFYFFVFISLFLFLYFYVPTLEPKIWAEIFSFLPANSPLLKTTRSLSPSLQTCRKKNTTKCLIWGFFPNFFLVSRGFVTGVYPRTHDDPQALACPRGLSPLCRRSIPAPSLPSLCNPCWDPPPNPLGCSGAGIWRLPDTWDAATLLESAKFWHFPQRLGIPVALLSMVRPPPPPGLLGTPQVGITPSPQNPRAGRNRHPSGTGLLAQP